MVIAPEPVLAERKAEAVSRRGFFRTGLALSAVLLGFSPGVADAGAMPAVDADFGPHCSILSMRRVGANLVLEVAYDHEGTRHRFELTSPDGKAWRTS